MTTYTPTLGEELILKEAAKKNGLTISKAVPFYRNDEREVFKNQSQLYSVFYEEKKGEDPEMILIDRSLIRELLEEVRVGEEARNYQGRVKFLNVLMVVLGLEECSAHAEILAATFATLPQLIEAFWMAFKEKS